MNKAANFSTIFPLLSSTKTMKHNILHTYTYRGIMQEHSSLIKILVFKVFQ